MDDPHNRDIISEMDMNSTQDDMSKLNSSPLKNIQSVDSGSTFHFVTYSQEYIDSAYLNTDLLSTQNGTLHVDFIPQSSLMDHNHSMQAYTTDDLQNLVVDTSQASVENDRKLFLQLVHKQSHGNEAPVIIANPFEPDSMSASVPSSPAIVSLNNHHLPTLHESSESHIRLYNPHSLANSTSQNSMPLLPPLTPIRRTNSPKRFIQQESTSIIKDEIDFETRTDDEDLFLDEGEKTLPHKKRLSKKLGDQRKSDQEISVISSNDRVNQFAFSCQICGLGINEQLSFFNHLKSHYEVPEPEVTVISAVIENNKKRPKLPRVKHTKKVKETHTSADLGHIMMHDNSGEFSEPEDMLEGIRTVVQETVDADSNDAHSTGIEKNWYNPPSFDTSDINSQEIHVTANSDNFVVYMDKNQFDQQQILADPHHSNHETHVEEIPILTFDESNQMQDIDKLVQYNMQSGTIVSNPVYHGDPNLGLTLKDEVKDVGVYDMVSMKHGFCDDPDDIDFQTRFGDSEEDEEDLLYDELEDEIEDNEQTPDENPKRRKTRYVVEETVDLDDGEKKIKKYKCTIVNCNRTFNSKTAIRYHELRHSGNRPHLCTLCGKGFLTSSALKVHGRLHSGEKPYKCNDCDKTFRQWGDMKYHMTSIHSSEKSHQCEFCGKEFARKYSLIVHRRIHTGEKNYVCDYCQKSFRASSYLQNHRRIHTGEKPHQCPYCAKKFRCRGDMKRHLTTHDREKGKTIHVNVLKNCKTSLKEDIIDLTTIKTKTEAVDSIELL